MAFVHPGDCLYYDLYDFVRGLDDESENKVYSRPISEHDFAISYRVTRRLAKKIAKFFQKIALKVAKSKIGQNIYNKAQLQAQKRLQQNAFET
jgi:hypothetical protein